MMQLERTAPTEPGALGDAATQNATLKSITWLICVVSTLLLPVVALTDVRATSLWTTAALCAVSWGTLILIRKGWTRHVAHWLIFSVLTVGTFGVLASGSVRSTAVFLFVGGVAGAGVFLGRRALIVVASYSTVMLGFITWAEMHGITGHFNPAVGISVWATQSTGIVVVGIVVYFSRVSALKAHQQQLDELLRSRALEQERDRARERFERIFRASPSPMLAQSALSGLVLDANPAFEQCFGYSKEQLLGRLDDYFWVDKQERDRLGETLFAERHLKQEPVRFLRSDGSPFDALISTELSNEPGDKLIISIVTDVSEQNRHLNQLRRSEERFAKAFALSPMSMAIVRLADGVVIDANKGRDSVTGYSAAELQGKTSLEVGLWTYPQARKVFFEQMKKNGRVRAMDVRLNHRDGHQLDARIWAELIELDGVPCLLSCMVDMTAEKRREAQLANLAGGMSGASTEAFFPTFIRHMANSIGADMVFLGEVDESRRVHTLAVFLDGQAVPNFSYELQETPCDIALDDREPCVYPDRVDQLFPLDATLVEGNFKAYVGHNLVDEDGRSIGVLAALWRKPLKNNPEVQALTSIFGGRANAELLRLQREREIQRLNETLEQRVQDRTADLQKLNAELESFAYSISHDLKTPLRSIDGFTQLLAESLDGRLTTEEQTLLGRVLSSTERMGKLISDMLALAHISQSDIQWQLVDLSQIAKETLDQLTGTLESGRKVQVHVTPDLAMVCDPHLMRIALENLLKNAVKYTRDQPATVIEFGRLHDASGVPGEFFVKDNGVGFDMAYADLLFKPFQRLHMPSSGYEGTGIGLATVRRILEHQGGRIRGVSAPGQGASFFFSLDKSI